VALIGHSHVALMYGYANDEFFGGLAPDGTVLDLRAGPYLLNPGSVGQPRDGDPRASFLVLDTEAEEAEWHRVEYDIAETQRLIDKVKLPRRLGSRLAEGR
jgi:diadenosine tetraphosphatase ApaH/serine/threonine PP2A family protein phosphatase